MSLAIEKRVTLSPQRAQQLAEHATQQGITEDALIEQALERLFQETGTEPKIAPELLADWEYLKQLEAELGPTKEWPSAPKIEASEIVALHCVPIDPASIVRPGETW